MKIYDTMRPKSKNLAKNFNFLPYFSLYFNHEEKKYTFLNIGWFNICFQFNLTRKKNL